MEGSDEGWLTVFRLSVEMYLRFSDALFGNGNDISIAAALASTAKGSQCAHGDAMLRGARDGSMYEQLV